MNKELYNNHVSDVLFLINTFTFSQTLLNHRITFICVLCICMESMKIATVKLLLMRDVKKCSLQLFKRQQSGSAYWTDKSGNNFEWEARDHLTRQQVQFSVLLPCQYSHLYHLSQCHYAAYQNYYASYFHSRLFHCWHFCLVITG